MNIRPDKQRRRSQLYRWHRDHGARFAEIDGAVYVESYEGHESTPLKLCDLSMLPRAGLKGRGAPQWLAMSIGRIPDKPNTAIHTKNGVVARLSREEFLLIGRSDFDATFINDIDRRLRETSSDGSYVLPRADSHCLFALAGKEAPDALAKICGIDFRLQKFANGNVAQTSMARVNAIIIRCDIGETPAFFTLCDTPSAEFMWDAILDAIEEFDGGAAGLMNLKRQEP